MATTYSGSRVSCVYGVESDVQSMISYAVTDVIASATKKKVPAVIPPMRVKKGILSVLDSKTNKWIKVDNDNVFLVKLVSPTKHSLAARME